MISDDLTRRQQVMDRYLALSARDQAVVNLLAVNWGALGLNQIKSALGIPNKPKLDLSPLEQQGVVIQRRTAAYSSQMAGFLCHPDIIELVTRHLVQLGQFKHFADLATITWPLNPPFSYVPKSAPGDLRFQNTEQFVREVRFGLYQGDDAQVEDAYSRWQRHSHSYWAPDTNHYTAPGLIHAQVCLNPFDPQWFLGLTEKMRRTALPFVIGQLALDWKIDHSGYEALAGQCRTLAIYPFGLILAALLRGDIQSATEFLAVSEENQPEILALRGLLNLLTRDVDCAMGNFEAALRLHRKLSGQRKNFLPRLGGVFYLLALILRNRGKDCESARKFLGGVSEWSPYTPLYDLMRKALMAEHDHSADLGGFRADLLSVLNDPKRNPWVAWLGLLLFCRFTDDPETLGPLLEHVEPWRNQAASRGLDWIAAELSLLLSRFGGNGARFSSAVDTFHQKNEVTLLGERVAYEAPWERALKAIQNTVTTSGAARKPAAAVGAECRLAWFVDEEYWGYAIEAREQKRTAQGWTKGKTLSLKSLQDTIDSRPYLTPHDIRVIAHIGQDSFSRAYRLTDRGWLALAGHPAVYQGQTGQHLEVVVALPELRIRKQPSGKVRIEFWPTEAHGKSLDITCEGHNRLKLTELRSEHHRLADIVADGITAPLSAQTRIVESLSAVSSLVAIHSDIGTAQSAGAATVVADSLPRIQLSPEGEGLRVAMLVRPFGERGPYYPPGHGSAGLIAEIDGQRLQTERDLLLERRKAADLIQLCPSLDQATVLEQPFHWFLEDTDSSLSLLLDLQSVGADTAAVEWPQGEKFRIAGQAGLSQMSLRVQHQRDWFSVNGELRLDSGEVLDMQTLLALIRDQPGKFIRLDGDRFLALTDAFRKRLEDLQSYSEAHGQGRRIHPLAIPVLDGLADEWGEFHTDAVWQQQLQRISAAEQLTPVLPSTLQAQLRDYQQEGFDWLFRLATWGVGACLADDMGLGKTVQAIALLLSRAGDGPSLVIAPTSVTFNWSNEITRFAPTLNIKTLTGDRQQVVDQLGPLDLLICSYGLLQQESVGEALARIRWRTVVLDEAQAIKNAATRRSQQAMALQADFKLITTGTPVENHLGELWNLFRFINPGLLGSRESFNRRFAGPIERNQDREARLRLKRLIQPFILRRTKSQVLEELPPRTEIELYVELSQAESTFYEALRRNLVTELERSEGPIEDRRFQVLAAITKLRRACCNPNLVAPELALPSSKLALLGEVLDELMANRHKVLVFSQFVDHLTIVRDYLDKSGVTYQYLDGQTPVGERKKRVEAFQLGQGDVFLISLKAGGTGLNLTAADYVIHLDPWWNPAVEDQASDRAHRIGQTRPVTIYRLVTKGTIEEQIVSLHRYKRELAESLLEGGDISARMGSDDLLQLMRDSSQP